MAEAPTVPGSVRKRWVLALLGAPLLVIGAVLLEVVGSAWANSPLPSWAEVVPLQWPNGARVVWWLAVAAAAASFRVSLRRVGVPTRALADVVTVLPFLVFAVGVAISADWATWH